jgi:thiamine-phosphate pyrophosphorylase
VYQLEKEIILTLCKKHINPGIYLISDQCDVLEFGLKNNVAIIQLRDKKSAKSKVLEKATHMQKLAQRYNVPFIVNDYLDIALAVDADGFHSGQDDIPVHVQRQLLGPHKIIGRTTHNLKQGMLAQKQGADYVSVGPIWQTPSKPGRKAIGFSYLKEAKTKLDIPYVAIGGINVENIVEVAVYNPPLIGIIRDYNRIPKLNKLFSCQPL